jgi:hypothetical protein
MKKQTIIPMAIVALAAGALFYAVYTVEPPGYCSARQSFVSDDDFIKSALLTEIKNGALKLDGSDGSIYRFRTEHPSCCTVDRTPRTLLERRFGINTVGVQVRYEVSHALAYETHLEAGSCGQMRTRRAYEIKREDLPITKN